MLAPGNIVDSRYLVLREIGIGAMGVVYHAKHLTLGRHVALKVLRAELAADPELAARFMQEARAASAIGHPGIIDIFDLGHCPDGSPYMAMELLDGVPLADHLAVEGSLPWPRVIELGAQFLAALAAAHNHGIVHRDLKPENIFLVESRDRPTQVKILDFGISKVLAHPGLEAAAPHTQYGIIMGTLAYMSPEQARGQTDLIDHRTDIFAAGVVLFEMLAGQPPFAGDSYNAVLSALLERRFEPLTAEVPPALERVIMRALAFDRERRWATAADMRDALVAARNEAGPIDVVTLDGWDDGSGRSPAGRAPDQLGPSNLTLAGTAPGGLARGDGSAPAAPEPTADGPGESPPADDFAPPPTPAIELELATPARPRSRRLESAPPEPPAPPPRHARTVLLLAGLVAGASAGAWLLARALAPAPDGNVTLRVRPAFADVRLDGVVTDARSLALAPGTSHTVAAQARGFVAGEAHFTAERGGTVELQLAHALPPVDDADIAALPCAPPLAPETVPTWDAIDHAIAYVEMQRECLVQASRKDCEILRQLALPLAPGPRAVTDAAAAYVRALADRENGRGDDVARAAGALRAEIWSERARQDAAELALLAAGGRGDDWHARRFLLAARACLLGDGPAPHAAAAESLEVLRRGPDRELAEAASDLLDALRRKNHKVVERYDALVERFNRRAPP